MKKPLWSGAAALALVIPGLLIVPGSAHAAPSSSVAYVKIAVSGDQATISQSTIRPGVVEFTVGSTFKIPGPDGGPDTLNVLRTDQLALVLSTLPAVFGDFTDPTAAAASAAGMRTIHAISTLYGGGNKGTTWQVKLSPGTYFVMGPQSTARGMAKPVSFTVAGEPRPGVIHATQATVRASGLVGANKFTFTRVGGLPVEWLRFTNAANELHFLDMSGVKPNVSDAMVEKAFSSPSPPKWVTGPFYRFDVISPGVSVAIKGPIDPGRYLIDCFIPSESDGMPHALMGMWKLVTVR